jgi:CheY-like chemotaxis protein
MAIKVLLIEDNSFARDVFRDCIAGLDCEFIDVEDHEQALEKIRSEEFDVIFLDLGLPEGDGLETFKRAKEIRADLAPVIIVTGHQEEARKRRALEMGVFLYLTKNNLSTEIITDAIQRALQLKQADGQKNEDTNC